MSKTVWCVCVGVSVVSMAAMGVAHAQGGLRGGGTVTAAQVASAENVKAPKLPKKSTVIGDFTAGGEAKEIAVNREIRHCYLQWLSGTPSINTVVIRPDKTALPQAVRLQPGALHVIDLGSKRHVAGFRISDGGRGTYRVIVK